MPISAPGWRTILPSARPRPKSGHLSAIETATLLLWDGSPEPSPAGSGEPPYITNFLAEVIGRYPMRKFLHLSFAMVLAFLGVMAAHAAPTKDEKKPDSAKPTIAVFRLHGAITESPAEESLPLFTTSQVSFKDLVARLKKAGDDASVKAVVLLPEGAALGAAQKEELRQV